MELRANQVINVIFFITNFIVALAFILSNRFPLIANPVFASIFFSGIILLETLTSFKLKNYIRILLFVTLTSHSLFGEYYRAYYTTAYFDNVLHCFGSFTFALLAFEIMNFFIKIHSSSPAVLIFLLVSLLGIALGTIFELIEFSLDILLKEYNQFGLTDTNLDLIYDAIGSFLAGIFVSSNHKLHNQ